MAHVDDGSLSDVRGTPAGGFANGAVDLTPAIGGGQRPPRFSVRFTPGATLLVLALIIGALTLANLARLYAVHILDRPTLMGLVRLFDVSGEGNLPATYSAAALFGAALLLAVIARRESHRGHRVETRAWFGLAILFCYLAIDEACQLHEVVSAAAKHVIPLGGFFYSAWVIPGMLAVAVLALAFVPWLWRLPARTRQLAILSAGVFLSGAVGCEMVSAWYWDQADGPSIHYDLAAAAEEFLEMTGVALWIYTLLSHLSQGGGSAFDLGVTFARHRTRRSDQQPIRVPRRMSVTFDASGSTVAAPGHARDAEGHPARS